MQKYFVLHIRNDTSVDRLNACIDRMQLQGSYACEVHVDSVQCIPLLKQRGVWNNICSFRYDGVESGLELPPRVQRVKLGWYNQPGLVLPESVQRVDFMYYNRPGLVLPESVQRVDFMYYNQPDLVLPAGVQHINFMYYNQPGLVLPKDLQHVELLRYNQGGLELLPSVQRAYIPKLGIHFDNTKQLESF